MTVSVVNRNVLVSGRGVAGPLPASASVKAVPSPPWRDAASIQATARPAFAVARAVELSIELSAPRPRRATCPVAAAPSRLAAGAHRTRSPSRSPAAPVVTTRSPSATPSRISIWLLSSMPSAPA